MIKRWNINKKIILGCIILIILPLLALGFRMYYSSNQFVENQLEANLKSRIEDYNEFYLEEINGNLALFFNIWHGNNNLEKAFSDPLIFDEFRRDWASALQGYPEVLSVYYSDTEGHFLNYPVFEVDESYDPTNRVWYLDAISNPDELNWSEPYIDYMTNEMIITLSQAQKNSRDEIIGVLAIDVTLKELSYFLQEALLTENSIMLLVSEKNIIIASSDLEELNENIDIYAFASSINKTEDSFSYKFEEERYLISYVTNAFDGWRLIVVVPENDYKEDLKSFYSIFIRISVMISIWGVLVIVILVYYSKKEFIKPIEVLQKKMKQAESGDLSFNVILQEKRTDEIGQLSMDFNQMIKGQKQLINKIKETAQVLGHTVDESKNVVSISSDHAEQQVLALQNLFQHLDILDDSIQEVSNHIEHITTNLGEFAEAMQHMGAAANEVAENTIQTAGSVSDISVSLKKLDKNIQSIHTNVLETTEQGVQVSFAVDKGKNHLGLTKKALSETQETIDDFLSEVHKLSDSANVISKIIGMIDDLTEQTTFLALNASIEAAKAGEHGKGFAVVANAVTRLSEKAKVSTQEVYQLIAKSQEQIHRTVDKVNASAEGIDGSMKAMIEMENAFKHIEDSIAVVNQQVEEIARNATEELNASHMIMLASENVSDATMQVSASTEEQVATFNDMIEKIEVMYDLASKVHALAKYQVEKSNDITNNGKEINTMTFDLSVMSENVEMISEKLEKQAEKLINIVSEFTIDAIDEKEQKDFES
ncbi:MAG: HAMP domain-containing protein [Clostridia bacterium]|nr:HAMP domain-containing protein [Clostridia bacterium]